MYNFKTVIFVIALFCATTASIKETTSDEWNDFKLKYNKVYNDADEDTSRKEIFEKNLQLIEDHNTRYEQGLETFTLGVNHLADFKEEVLNRITFCTTPTQPPFSTSSFKLSTDLPESVDWREKGIMTAVRDQGTCGSCWACAAIGTIEARLNIINVSVPLLSVQHIIDCDTKYQGCTRGNTLQAYGFIARYTGGLFSEEDYPYQGVESTCQYPAIQVVQTHGYAYLPYDVTEREEKLAEFVSDGPVSAGILISVNDREKFAFYNGTYIYSTEDCASEIPRTNHAVIVAGYGRDNGEDFWLIKNSFGEDWGDNGYMKLKRNAGNHCGIALDINYPILI